MSKPQPSYEEFAALGREHNIIPVYKTIRGAEVSPLAAAWRLAPERPCFLLESLGPYGEFARASFMGLSPIATVKARPGRVEITDLALGASETYKVDAHAGLRLFMSRFKPAAPKGLTDFWGGAVGFMGYDTVRYIERLPQLNKVDPEALEMQFQVCRDTLRFDRASGDIRVVHLVYLKYNRDLDEAYREALGRIAEIEAKLMAPSAHEAVDHRTRYRGSESVSSNMTKEYFEDMVLKAKEHIKAGDIIQAVVSQRLSADFEGDPLALYEALQRINPSPYSFFLNQEEMQLVGASPEMLVRLTGDRIQVRPIAGTRPRGKSPEEDERLAAELLADPKELAEHIMLVDLGRNDIGRVAHLGSVSVPRLMTIENYSHVMHIVSHVEGVLAQERSPIDLVRAVFPAGTLSGAPKVRAMEIIEELEPMRRDAYGGAVGYFSFSGDADFCITIRTLVVEKGRAWVQAGAGIVADSVPETEYQETLHKARAVLNALAQGTMEV